MPFPRLARPARTLALPATAFTYLLRPSARLLFHSSSRASATAATPVVAAVAFTDLPCSHSHYTSVVASPSPRASSSTSRASGCGGLVALTITASAVWLPVLISARVPNPACSC
jgi:hypothetical protein